MVTFGLHAVRALLQHSPEQVRLLWVQKDKRDAESKELLQIAKTHGISVANVAKADLTSASEGGNHQGVVAWHRDQGSKMTEQDLPRLCADTGAHALFLILDGVQDPHNLGACLRTADAMGVQAVIIPKDNAVGMTPVVRKVASGAADTVPLIMVTNLARTMRLLQENGVWIYGASHDADKSLSDARFSGAVAIVMGAEGSGIRRLTKEHCDELLFIPMQGTVSSFNVSVAAGILLYEVVRQRR